MSRTWLYSNCKALSRKRYGVLTMNLSVLALGIVTNVILSQTAYGQSLREWDFCSSNGQCASGCCSRRLSDDGRFKCHKQEYCPGAAANPNYDPPAMLQSPDPQPAN